MRGDGDGWAVGPGGMRKWGRFGAAGLLLRAPLETGEVAVLLQLRAAWSHEGGTWALPGGARDSDETPVHAAVREAFEEAGIESADIRVRAQRVTAADPGGWTYTTVIADAGKPLPVRVNQESVELAWVPEHEVDQRPLHAGFAAAWPDLRATPARVDPTGLPAPHAAELAEALPRTIELNAGYVWVHAEADGPGVRTIVVDGPVEAAGSDTPESRAADRRGPESAEGAESPERLGSAEPGADEVDREVREDSAGAAEVSGAPAASGDQVLEIPWTLLCGRVDAQDATDESVECATSD